MQAIVRQYVPLLCVCLTLCIERSTSAQAKSDSLKNLRDGDREMTARVRNCKPGTCNFSEVTSKFQQFRQMVEVYNRGIPDKRKWQIASLMSDIGAVATDVLNKNEWDSVARPLLLEAVKAQEEEAKWNNDQLPVIKENNDANLNKITPKAQSTEAVEPLPKGIPTTTATVPPQQPPPAPLSTTFFRIAVSPSFGVGFTSLKTPLVFVPADPDGLKVHRVGSLDTSIPLCGGGGHCVLRQTEQLSKQRTEPKPIIGLGIDLSYVTNGIEFGASGGLRLGFYSGVESYQYYFGPRVAGSINGLQVGLAPMVGTTRFISTMNTSQVLFSEPSFGSVEAEKGSPVEAWIRMQYGIQLEARYFRRNIAGPLGVGLGLRPLVMWDGGDKWMLQFPVTFTVAVDSPVGNAGEPNKTGVPQ